MSKFCPFCGEKLVDEAKFCRSCGKNIENVAGETPIQTTPQFEVPTVEKEHTLLIVLGYVFSILIPLIGIIIAIYLLTRKDSSKANKHGKYVLVVALVVWFLSFISIFMY